MIIEIAHNIHKICSWVVWMTFTCEVKIYLIKSELMSSSFFVNLLHIFWIFDIWQIIDISLKNFLDLLNILVNVSPHPTIPRPQSSHHYMCPYYYYNHHHSAYSWPKMPMLAPLAHVSLQKNQPKSCEPWGNPLTSKVWGLIAQHFCNRIDCCFGI